MSLRDSRSLTRLKNLARPVLMPLMKGLGWNRRPAVYVPRISRGDRLDEHEVPTRVAVDEEQTFLVNGTPFFPMGLYYTRDQLADESGAGLHKLRKMGFNTIFFDGGPESRDELDRIWNAGLRVWYRPPGQLHRDFRLLKEIVTRFARHPALLLWEMDDEPVLNRIRLSDVEIGCRIIRGIDPYHPILCNQWLSSLDQAEEMKQWAALADVNGFSIYPVPLERWGKRMSLVEQGWPHSIAVVGKQVDLWKSLAPHKPIVPVLQAWAWNCIEDGESGYPTYGQARFMAYQAVIHGAKGLHHYGAVECGRPNFACGIPPRLHEDLELTHADFISAQCTNEQFWSYYSSVIKELSLMSTAFSAHDTSWKPEITEETGGWPESRAIECRVKRYADSFVVLIVNASESTSALRVCARELASCVLNLWGEGRSIQVDSDGQFEDCIEGFGVRIYSDQPDVLKQLSNSINSGDENGSYG